MLTRPAEPVEETTGAFAEDLEAAANQSKISLRTACFCNPGAGEVAHGLSGEEMARAFRDGERMTFSQFLSVLESNDGTSTRAVLVSLGMASNFEDVRRFARFARGLLDRRAAEL